MLDVSFRFKESHTIYPHYNSDFKKEIRKVSLWTCDALLKTVFCRDRSVMILKSENVEDCRGKRIPRGGYQTFGQVKSQLT